MAESRFAARRDKDHRFGAVGPSGSPGWVRDDSLAACRERVDWLEEQRATGRTDLGPAFADAEKNLAEALKREGETA